MRAVFIGASTLAVTTARTLLERGHEAVIIERDPKRIEALDSELDCGFIHGDGSKPAILAEADARHTDVLLCLTDSDQANIIASLVGRSLGFKRVVTRIEDPEFEHICIELALEDIIVPSRTIGRHLADLCLGYNPLELSTMIRDEARVFSFVVHEDQARSLAELELPDRARVICLYRAGKLLLPAADQVLKDADEVVLITHRDCLSELQERLSAPPGD